MIRIATTGIWKIEKRLDHVIDYTTNIEKTINLEYGNKSYQELHNLKEYENAEYISEQQFYVSGINCLPDYAYEEMKITKEAYNKNNGILGFHAFQSFKEGEVTPDLAHKIGVKLAEEMWGDRFEVIVSTHINTNHIHNHFVINSVSFVDGKKYYDNHENYALLRRKSDELCEEYGLSVLEEKTCKRSGINYANYYKGYVENNNYYKTTKSDIDKAIGMATSLKDFEALLIKMGYEYNIRYEKITLRRNPYRKNIRIERCFGEEYSISKIENRIQEERSTRVPFVEALNPNYKVKLPKQEIKKLKSKGIYGLYKYYCYLLKVYPKMYPKKYLSPTIRLEVKKLNSITKQSELLVKNNITTYDEFIFYKQSIVDEIEQLKSEKHSLWIKHNKSTNEEEKTLIYEKIQLKTNKLSTLKREEELCEEIEKRINPKKLELQENIKELEELEDGKEKMKNEF